MPSMLAASLGPIRARAPLRVGIPITKKSGPMRPAGGVSYAKLGFGEHPDAVTARFHLLVQCINYVAA